MHAIDRNNYGELSIMKQTTRGNENNTALCFIEIATQMLVYLNVIN
jgi:hypothetical protein